MSLGSSTRSAQASCAHGPCEAHSPCWPDGFMHDFIQSHWCDSSTVDDGLMNDYLLVDSMMYEWLMISCSDALFHGAYYDD